MVLNPHVADDYRAYYIDRSRLVLPAASSRGYYPLGEPISFVPGPQRLQARHHALVRLHAAHRSTGIRSFGDYGILQLKFPLPDEDLLLTFSSWVNYRCRQAARARCRCVVNGEQVGTLTFTSSAARVNGKIVIPARRRRRQGARARSEIRFNVPRTGPPGTNSEPHDAAAAARSRCGSCRSSQYAGQAPATASQKKRRGRPRLPEVASAADCLLLTAASVIVGGVGLRIGLALS